MFQNLLVRTDRYPVQGCDKDEGEVREDSKEVRRVGRTGKRCAEGQDDEGEGQKEG